MLTQAEDGDPAIKGQHIVFVPGLGSIRGNKSHFLTQWWAFWTGSSLFCHKVFLNWLRIYNWGVDKKTNKLVEWRGWGISGCWESQIPVFRPSQRVFMWLNVAKGCIKEGNMLAKGKGTWSHFCCALIQNLKKLRGKGTHPVEDNLSYQSE